MFTRYSLRLRAVFAAISIAVAGFATASMLVASTPAAASTLAKSGDAGTASPMSCPIWEWSCYHYGGQFKTESACDARGSYLEQGVIASGYWTPGYECQVVQPSGYYDLWYWVA